MFTNARSYSTLEKRLLLSMTCKAIEESAFERFYIQAFGDAIWHNDFSFRLSISFEDTKASSTTQPFFDGDKRNERRGELMCEARTCQEVRILHVFLHDESLNWG